jgi:hypothetical protein
MLYLIHLFSLNNLMSEWLSPFKMVAQRIEEKS